MTTAWIAATSSGERRSIRHLGTTKKEREMDYEIDTTGTEDEVIEREGERARMRVLSGTVSFNSSVAPLVRVILALLAALGAKSVRGAIEKLARPVIPDVADPQAAAFAPLARETLYRISSAIHAAEDRGERRDITSELEAYLGQQFAAAVGIADGARATEQREKDAAYREHVRADIAARTERATKADHAVADNWEPFDPAPSSEPRVARPDVSAMSDAAQQSVAMLREEVAAALAWKEPGGMRPNHPPELAGCPAGALKAIQRMLPRDGKPDVSTMSDEELAAYRAKEERDAIAWARTAPKGEPIPKLGSDEQHLLAPFLKRSALVERMIGVVRDVSVDDLVRAGLTSEELGVTFEELEADHELGSLRAAHERARGVILAKLEQWARAVSPTESAVPEVAAMGSSHAFAPEDLWIDYAAAREGLDYGDQHAFMSGVEAGRRCAPWLPVGGTLGHVEACEINSGRGCACPDAPPDPTPVRRARQTADAPRADVWRNALHALGGDMVTWRAAIEHIADPRDRDAWAHARHSLLVAREEAEFERERAEGFLAMTEERMAELWRALPTLPAGAEWLEVLRHVRKLADDAAVVPLSPAPGSLDRVPAEYRERVRAAVAAADANARDFARAIELSDGAAEARAREATRRVLAPLMAIADEADAVANCGTAFDGARASAYVWACRMAKRDTSPVSHGADAQDSVAPAVIAPAAPARPRVGPWVNEDSIGPGDTLYDERGAMVGRVFIFGGAWHWWTLRPHAAPRRDVAADRGEARAAAQASLETWCDVSALDAKDVHVGAER